MIVRDFVNTTQGWIHFRTEGKGKPVLLLHQTPRSSDEFLEIIPLLAKEGFRAIAPDTPGFGDSYKPISFSMHEWAKSLISFADALALEEISIVGHHTGAVIAFEMAVSFPKRIEKLVLSNCPYIDQQKRKMMQRRGPLDEVKLKEDGGHLIELWNGRKNFYPKHRPDLLTRFVLDALKAGRFSAEGHKVVRAYNMEGKFAKINCPTLLICGTKDPFVYPDLRRLEKKMPEASVREIKSGMVPMMDQMPRHVAKVLVEFLKGNTR